MFSMFVSGLYGGVALMCLSRKDYISAAMHFSLCLLNLMLGLASQGML